MIVISLETIHRFESSKSSAISQGSQWGLTFFFNVYLLHWVLVATHRIFSLH